jgi:hypothetical protein
MLRRDVLCIAFIALAPALSAATQYVSQEEVERRKAKLASWDGLDGVWEGTIAAPPPINFYPLPAWRAHVSVSGLDITFSIRHLRDNTVVEVRHTADYINPKLGIFFDANVTTPEYRGKFEIALMREEKDEATLVVMRWYPPPTAPDQLQEGSSWNGTVRRARASDGQLVMPLK